MDIEYIKKNYTFELLTKEHDLSYFQCDSKDLNDFLKDDALIQQKNKFNITKLICCDKKIIGYFSLLADTIKINKLSEEDSNKLNEKTDFKELPAIKIGRFAIDETYTNKGLGTLILENIMNIIYILSTEYIGVRYITVDGYAKAYNFYEKNGFSVLKKDKETINNIDKIIKKDPERTIALYFDINRASKELNE